MKSATIDRRNQTSPYEKDGLEQSADRRDDAGRTTGGDTENAVVMIEPESAVWAGDHAAGADVRASRRPDNAEWAKRPSGSMRIRPLMAQSLSL
jgi:hypothetical protein